jgi:hypothetical protein
MAGRTSLRKEGANEAGSSSTTVAHTLTACTRCRVVSSKVPSSYCRACAYVSQRKTRCDPSLPKCGPCERTGSTCEYYDSSKGRVLNRNYVIYLQHKVKELEEELEREESGDTADDPEAMMRAATVRMQDATEPKYLGASSGITTTRLVMQLAKQFTDSKSIREIVPDVRAQQIKELYSQEQAKPTSKVYPVTSNVAAPDLPNRGLAKILVDLYILKVQPMYPALHEPSLEADIEAVYNEEIQSTPYQNFVARMVISISLQKMDTQYAGLADSFYLAALKYLEPCVRPMDLSTLQCFALMAEYSLLTPTRTAIYYVVGIAVRLAQALGLHEEKTITRGRDGNPADPLEIDMRRRLFWCIIVMEFGLSHALGRPAILATDQEHFDVNWFETCEDKYITRNGIDPAATPTLKKWITIHFFKMRLLQLEIRRKLYRSKQPEPRDDNDPWFHQMDAKLEVWRDSSPNKDEGAGFDKRWFIVRYNTMLAFLYRPSPQVPRPSLQAALKCFEACQYNIYIQKEQIDKKSVDLTWIFTQAIFMAMNTMLWSLSYVEVRRKHSRESVDKHMKCAMDAIKLASERWPGVASAVQLYQNLIEAVLKVYEKDGDIPISAATPSDAASPAVQDPNNSSNVTSPATVASSSVATPPGNNGAPFGYINQQSRRSVEQAPPMPYSSGTTPPVVRSPPVPQQNTQAQSGADQYFNNNDNYNNYNYNQNANGNIGPPTNNMAHQPTYDMPNQWNHLPNFLPDYTWPQNAYANPDQQQQQQQQQQHQQQANLYPQIPQHNQPQQPFPAYIGQNNNNSTTTFLEPTYPYPAPGAFDPQPVADQYMQELWELDGNAWNNGLTQQQQQELMDSLERDGMEDIQGMITTTQAMHQAMMQPKGSQGRN